MNEKDICLGVRLRLGKFCIRRDDIRVVLPRRQRSPCVGQAIIRPGRRSLFLERAQEQDQRLETLVLSAGLDLPLRAVRSTIVLAIDLVVIMARMADGSRRVTQVTEITGMELDNITLSDLFLVDSRKTPGGMGFTLRPTGAMPRFYDELRKQGEDTPLEFFQEAAPGAR